MGKAATANADLCDANPGLLATGHIRVIPPIFKIYGKRRSFSGPIMTVRLHDNNNGVMWSTLESEGCGRVIVMDNGGSTNCACLGGQLSQLAETWGWAGVVVYGCIRDVDEVDNRDIGVRALATHPRRAGKKLNGEKHVPLCIKGVEVRDGDWLYADADGIIVSDAELPPAQCGG